MNKILKNCQQYIFFKKSYILNINNLLTKIMWIYQYYPAIIFFLISSIVNFKLTLLIISSEILSQA